MGHSSLYSLPDWKNTRCSSDPVYDSKYPSTFHIHIVSHCYFWRGFGRRTHLAGHGPSILRGSSFEPFTGMQSDSMNYFPQSHLRSFQRSLFAALAATEHDQCVVRDVRNRVVSPGGRVRGVEGVESASSDDGDAERSEGCFFRFFPGSISLFSFID